MPAMGLPIPSLVGAIALSALLLMAVQRTPLAAAFSNPIAQPGSSESLHPPRSTQRNIDDGDHAAAARVQSRRQWMSAIAKTATVVALVETQQPSLASAAAAAAPTTPPRERLQEASDALDKLLTNWKRATVDCTFADVPRELLEAKNKELLLEKASTFALFDKSVSVESCKTTNRIVRDYLGVTGKGPLVGLEKAMKLGMRDVDDDIEDYVEQMEDVMQAMARAASLSYAAGVADFDAVNNFSKEDSDREDDDSNLGQTKAAIVQIKAGLDKMISHLT
mmetsp:Transcript_7622/g.20656  ORF Transcript_7622/g.20656 Transcript_7622/m.20656 type:complete len:279 (-) Transcript_7622:688-1524(-)